MRIKRDWASKTLWLQIGVLAAAAVSDELLHVVKERPLAWIAANAVLTVAARMIRFRRPKLEPAKLYTIRKV